MVPLVFTAAALLCFLPRILGTPEDPSHIGCFSTDFVKSHEYYNIRYALTWEDSIAFCNHRLTVYMGIQEENSSSKYNFVYCGNDIKEHSRPANSSLCRPCVHNKDRFCGGDSTLSLYRLRDKSPLTYFLLYSNTILMTKGDNTNITILSGQSQMNSVDFLFTEDDLFFINVTSINR
ncbi:uncharacterized protein LOC124355541 [Homalodisca vitripennis]|uniref:uncharacterized protein LOC124355541 n=1 Tax=Homalodisca vitripennis TaxID=197043 RepID=UPI001EEA2C4B|nr:uncharacterized protein LOC124355541 [Homalodisca vitripennis]